MLQKIDVKSVTENVFSMIGDRWLLITAGKEGQCNPMTASWGGLGVLWGKNVATIYVRPQRFTYGLVEASDTFALNVLPEGNRDILNLCGTKSGRDMDKMAACGLTAERAECGAPYLAQAELVLVCRKLYSQDIDPVRFIDKDIDHACYPGKDYHRMYIGEIVEALKKA